MIQIGNRSIGAGQPVYVIAEIGSNHDGNLEQAFELIRLASEAGADAAKFQFYRADRLYPGTVTPGAIPDWWLPELQACCRNHQVEFICSVFDGETLATYMAHEPAAIKIASPEATNRDLVAAACSWGVPVIVSTGAMTFDQTLYLTRWRAQVVVMHCLSAYPADPAQLNLVAIRKLAAVFDAVGFSDHTLEPALAPVVAVALGACTIEKHLTLDRTLPGPDHPFALEPDEFAQMVEGVRQVPPMLGDGVKRVMPSEDPTDRRMTA